MDYQNLIERLKKETYWLGGSQPYSRDVHPAICDEAANAITDLLARAEAAEARAEKAEKQRDAAIGDLEKLCRDDIGPCEMNPCEICAYDNGAQCLSPHGQICDGYEIFNWKWRGQKEE